MHEARLSTFMTPLVVLHDSEVHSRTCVQEVLGLKLNGSTGFFMRVSFNQSNNQLINQSKSFQELFCDI